MKKSLLCISFFILVSMFSCSLMADEKNFVTLHNHKGSGLFILDTRTGEVWLSSFNKKKWLKHYTPKKVVASPSGTYTITSNLSGAGCYITNTFTGDTVWKGTDSVEYGIPKLTTQDN